MGVAIGDYNHTGRPSIYVTDFADEYDTLYRNHGDWEFDDVSYKSGSFTLFSKARAMFPPTQSARGHMPSDLNVLPAR
jgi:hypothetical protein